MDKKSTIDLHLSSTHYADRRTYQIRHCQMVNWLVMNFIKIKNKIVTYQDYENLGKDLGIIIFNEESFNLFKDQEYI